jgi:membrane-bound lytic murein transglycosylase B
MNTPHVIAASILLMTAVGRAAAQDAALHSAFEGLRASSPALIRAQRADALSDPPSARARALVKAKLTGSGVPDAYVDGVFNDSRTKLFPEIPGKFGGAAGPAASVPYDQYRKYFMTEANIAAGAQFVRDHRDLLDAVQARYGVNGALLVALVSVETRYGTNVGKYPVFDALNTIIQGVPSRSNWATREAAEFLKMTYAQNMDAHAVLGSYAGAFGYVQFEPSTYNAVAVDFDDDGQRRLDQWPDALASCANYLKRAGYDASAPYAPDSKIGRALFSYNHSDNYVRAILELRGEIQTRLP